MMYCKNLIKSMVEELKENGWCFRRGNPTEKELSGLLSEISNSKFSIRKNLIYPLKVNNGISLSNIYGLKSFPFHNDGVQNVIPPKFIVLKLISKDTDIANTLLIDGIEMAKKNPQLFFNSVFKIKGNGFTELTPLINKVKYSEELLRYNPIIMTSLQKQKKDLVEHLLLDNDRIVIDWIPNSFLIVDNWRILHSREEIKDLTKKRVFERLEFYYKKYE